MAITMYDSNGNPYQQNKAAFGGQDKYYRPGAQRGEMPETGGLGAYNESDRLYKDPYTTFKKDNYFTGNPNSSNQKVQNKGVFAGTGGASSAIAPYSSGSYRHGYTPGKLDVAQLPYGVPTYGSILNSGGTGYNKDAAKPYTMTDAYDPTAQNNLSAYANSTTDSPWLTLMKQQAGRDAGIQRGDLNSTLYGGLATGRDNLAMRGGLRGGAGAAMESRGLRDLMMGQQRIGQGQYGSNMANSLAEETSKLSLREKLPGMEMARAQNAQYIQGQNIANLTAERERQYGAGQGVFDTIMKAWGAAKSA